MDINEILNFNKSKTFCNKCSEPLGEIQENRGNFFCYKCNGYIKVDLAKSLVSIEANLEDLREKFKVEVINDSATIIVQPEGALEKQDFERLAQEIDSFSTDESSLAGLVIHTRTFPGWDDIDAFLSHMRFVKDHHKKIARVAIVTDSTFLTIAPEIVKHFVSAEVMHFDYDELEAAKHWITESHVASP